VARRVWRRTVWEGGARHRFARRSL
jgi:hypothetical protein